MTEQNRKRSNRLNWQFLDKLKRKTLINSTASSLRLAGINITNKEVGWIIDQSVASSNPKRDVVKKCSPKQLTVLNYLAHVSQASPGEITKATNVARPTVSQALNTLMRSKKIEHAYETILERDIDKRNFRKKLQKLDIVKPLKRKRFLGRARPAELYHFPKTKVETIEML